jgi:signal transduction histidine kinase
MVNFVKRVAEWGIKPDTPVDTILHIKLTNVVLLFMMIASIVNTAVIFYAGAKEAALLNSTAPLVFGTGLLLMKNGKTVIARTFVLLMCTTAGYATMTMLGEESHLQFMFLFASSFSIALFNRKELWLLFFGLTTPLIAFVMLEITDYQPVFGMARAQLDPGVQSFLRFFSTIMIWVLMISQFLYFIRDRKKSQEQLISTGKMVALGQMAAGIAHEVNTPLQIIVAHAERLKAIPDASPEVGKKLNDISDQIQTVAMRIGAINKGLLAMARESGNDPLEEVPLHMIVDLALDFCRAQLEANRIDLRIVNLPKHWCVIGRETQLSEVILNIINNSLYALKSSSEKWIEIDSRVQKDWIEISITDSGPGVKSEILPRIFDPFFSTKPIGQGTGLGLSISHGIIASHNGRLYYEPRPSGARFVIKLRRGPDVE